MEDTSKEIVLKTSRIYFWGNYLIALLVAVVIFLLVFVYNFGFTLFPRLQSELISTLIILIITTVGVAMIEQPEWARFRTKFIITKNEVIKQEGIFNRHRVILPYGTVADISVERSLVGRLLNYGTLSVSSFKSGSDMVMKGIRDSEKYHIMIQNRVNLIREGQLKLFGKDKDKDEEE